MEGRGSSACGFKMLEGEEKGGEGGCRRREPWERGAEVGREGWQCVWQ